MVYLLFSLELAERRNLILRFHYNIGLFESSRNLFFKKISLYAGKDAEGRTKGDGDGPEAKGDLRPILIRWKTRHGQFPQGAGIAHVCTVENSSNIRVEFQSSRFNLTNIFLPRF